MKMKNSEGYADNTAEYALNNVSKEQDEVNNRARELVSRFKYIADKAGFKVTGRIQIKDKKSGKEFK